MKNNIDNNIPLNKLIIFGSNGYLGGSLYQGLKNFFNVIPSSRKEQTLHYLSQDKCNNIPRDVNASIFAIGSTELDSGSFYSSVNSSLDTFALFLDRHKKDIPKTPIIYISTFQVYGTYSGFIDEDTETNPQNIYSLVHKQAEDMLRIYAKKNGINFLIIRPTNIYGSFSSVFPSRRKTLVPNCFIEEALTKGTITINASGSVYRDFINVKDIISSFRVLLNDFSSFSNLEVINFCSENIYDIFDIALLLKKIIKKEFNQNIELLTPNRMKEEVSSSNIQELIVTSKYKKLFPFKEYYSDSISKELLNLIKGFKDFNRIS